MIWVTEKGFENDDILQCILDAVARAEAEQEKDVQPVVVSPIVLIRWFFGKT